MLLIVDFEKKELLRKINFRRLNKEAEKQASVVPERIRQTLKSLDKDPSGMYDVAKTVVIVPHYDQSTFSVLSYDETYDDVASLGIKAWKKRLKESSEEEVNE